jgi:organic radical activating enzyme
MEEWEVMAKIPKDIPLIIITGGEPALQNWDDLINAWETYVGHARTKFAIETSGQYPWLGDRRLDWVCVSPKWSHAANKSPWYVDGAWWTYVDELKYVVDDMFHEAVVDAHLSEMRLNATRRFNPEIVLMPEGCPPPQANIDRTLRILETHREWRFGPRLQYYMGVK